ncbi:hypothetical protein [Acuticoccus kandeliae]|uniref:hypothetical protein n=1 Tax=Acuticoccus kandeliae TaxID=2073160 RepID=UPI00130041E7|nr:hypothetical protein [Acuticoccus kandeliae]
MQRALGALTAVAVLCVILLGPVFLAVSAADHWTVSERCGSQIGCESTANPVTGS